MINKKRILQSFQRAADSYESQAMVQHRVAENLLRLLDEHCCGEINRVLEIGCCTGLLTRRLVKQYPNIMEIVLNDLVESFAARAGDLPGVAQVSFLSGDIETLPLSGEFDLIISSSTFHWVHDLDALLAKLTVHLKPGATLAFSLYGPDNMMEIRSISDIGLPYYSLARVKHLLSRYCTVDHCSEGRETFFFADPDTMLEHLRQTGVNALQTTPWTPRKLKRFKNDYLHHFSERQGVRLSYHPLYLLAHR